MAQILTAQLPLVVGGISLTILITFLFSHYELRQSLKTGSLSLIADSCHVPICSLRRLSRALFLGRALGFTADRCAALVAEEIKWRIKEGLEFLRSHQS